MLATNANILSAMITPAVLISACGTLILSTSNRLGRAADRLRRTSDRIRQLATISANEREAYLEQEFLEQTLPDIMRRMRLIHRSLTAFYTAVAWLVLCSIVIGGSGIIGLQDALVPVLLGLAGAVTLCYGVAILTVEARLSLRVSMREMEFIQGLMERRHRDGVI